jgi:hypothetical protein
MKVCGISKRDRQARRQPAGLRAQGYPRAPSHTAQSPGRLQRTPDLGGMSGEEMKANA